MAIIRVCANRAELSTQAVPFLVDGVELSADRFELLDAVVSVFTDMSELALEPVAFLRDARELNPPFPLLQGRKCLDGSVRPRAKLDLASSLIAHNVPLS